jgi:hypothetical protein
MSIVCAAEGVFRQGLNSCLPCTGRVSDAGVAVPIDMLSSMSDIGCPPGVACSLGNPWAPIASSLPLCTPDTPATSPRSSHVSVIAWWAEVHRKEIKVKSGWRTYPRRASVSVLFRRHRKGDVTDPVGIGWRLKQRGEKTLVTGPCGHSQQTQPTPMAVIVQLDNALVYIMERRA